ncbi:proline racemase family protein [Novipirellula rosea]|uniref:4-hydroxyproline epimerase n=1 Tax=Novipirellula rosea TaxID=1031540 RepID=A0ABP8NTT8_9BACT|tara:strand:+ start:17166 stop:18200 length:1035 start_codon:yes stop_codon:yes gene_type:complete
MKVSAPKIERISTVDSHTCGEPTRTIVSGGPDLGKGTLMQRQQRFAKEFDHYRTAVINEPRGSDVLVGALLCKPTNPEFAGAVIFFNNTGYLGMCGHGAIGVAATLAYLGRIGPGFHQLETSVGVIGFELDEDMHRVTIENVPSYRYRKAVAVEVPGFGQVVGDIAWGGNWFFLVRSESAQIRPQHLDELLVFTKAIRKALEDQAITGHGGKVIDHIELYCDSGTSDGRNFVLCPGGQWDRSPCGTGTSAKVACLAADGELAPGKRWHQESIIGTYFEANYRVASDQEIKQLGNIGLDPKQTVDESVSASTGIIVPSVTGEASVTAESQLLLDPDDAFRYGIPV